MGQDKLTRKLGKSQRALYVLTQVREKHIRYVANGDGFAISRDSLLFVCLLVIYD